MNKTRQTRNQRKSAIIAMLRKAMNNIDSVCEDICSDTDAYKALQNETKSIDKAIDLICEF